MAEKLIKYLLKFRYFLLLLILIGTIYFGLLLSDLQTDADPGYFLPEGMAEEYYEGVKPFGTDFEKLIIVLQSKDNRSIMDIPLLQEQQKIVEVLEKQNHTFYSLSNIISKTLAFNNESLYNATNWSDLREIHLYSNWLKKRSSFYEKDIHRFVYSIFPSGVPKDFVFDSRLLFGPLQVQKSQIAVEIPRYPDKEDILQDIDLIVSEIDGLNLTHTKVDYAQLFLFVKESEGIITQVMTNTIIAVLISLLVVLFFFLRDYKKVLISFAIISTTMVWTLGISVLLDFKMSAATIALIGLLLGITIDDSIHFLNGLNNYLKDKTWGVSIRTVLRHTGIAMFLTSVTTIIGFLSGVFVNLRAIKEYSILLSIGIGLGFIFSVIYVTTLSSIMKVKYKPVWQIDLTILRRLLKFTLSHTRLIVVSLSLFVAVCLSGLFLINSNYDLIDFLPKELSQKIDDLELDFDTNLFVRVNNAREIDDIYGKIYTFHKLLGQSVHIPNLEGRIFVEDISDYVYNLVKEKRNLSSILGVTPGGAPTRHDFNLELLLSAVNKSDNVLYPGSTETFKSRFERIYDFDSGDMLIRIHSNLDKIQESKELHKEVMNYLAQVGITDYDLFGTLNINYVTADLIIKSQYLSLLIAFFAILLFLSIRYRSVVVSSFLLLPLVLIILIMLGLMGLFSIPLNPITVTISAVIIGLGVDFNIHIFQRYRSELRKNKNRQKCFEKVFDSIGESLIFSTLTTVIAFIVLIFSGFSVLMWFGALSALAMSFGLFLSFILMPILFTRIRVN